MNSLLQSAALALLIIVFCLLIGATLRSAALGIKNVVVDVVDLPLGYAITSLILVVSLKFCSGLSPGIAVLALLIVYSLTRRFVFTSRTNRFGLISLAICAAFVAAAVATYSPLLWDFGTAFQPPQIYDAPKHILTMTALGSSATWPPQNPFMPGLGFAYNFGFYVIPAAIINLGADNRLAIAILPWLVVISATSALLMTLAVAERIGTPKAGLPIVALAATWLGGLTPFLAKTYPPLGFRLLTEGIVTRPIWADEPIISAIFAPQHLFASTCLLAMIYIASSSGSVWRRALLSAVLCLAASLSSLILLPHISVILAFTVFMMATEYQKWSQFAFAALILAAYAVALLPFFLDAMHWQDGTGGSPAGYPPDVKTIGVVILSLGPVFFLAAIGAWRSYKTRDIRTTSYVLVPIAISAIAALLLQYSEAPFKSTLLLRTVLPCFAGLGFVAIWTFLERRWQRIAFALVLAMCIAINAPTTLFFAAASWKPFAASERTFLQAMQTTKAPIFFDGVSDQWIASLAVKQTILDFRSFRTDAYLPPEDRASYARFFDEQTRHSWEENDLGGVVATPDKAAAWSEGKTGTPMLRAMGMVLIPKE